MDNKELIVQGDVPAIADDFLVQVADQAEKRIDAVIKIKKVALKVTNARDWTDQNGNPYLQVSGSEKIANLFNISWGIGEPQYEVEADGHFSYAFRGEFRLGGRSIECEGVRSSKDPFFTKYDKSTERNAQGKYPKLPPSSIDKGDVKKAALTNLFGNGITRILGIRNLTWGDLQEFAGINQADVQSIQYNKGGNKPPIAKPQAKGEAEPSASSDSTPAQHGAIFAILKKLGVEDDYEKHEKVSKVLKLETVITTMKELTKKQASTAIELLGKEAEK